MIKKNNIITSILYSLAILCSYFFLISILSWSNWLIIYTLILLFSLFLGGYLVYTSENVKLWSFKFLFIFFTVVFHFGQLFLYNINYDFADMTNFLLKFSNSTLTKTLLFSYLVTCFIFVGMLLSKPKEGTHPGNLKINKNGVLKSTAWSIIILCFPLNLYSNYKTITNTLMDGYSTTGIVEFSALSDIGFLSYTGFALLLLLYPKHTWKFKALVVFLFTYLGITMISGARGMSILIIGLIFYILLFKTNKKIKIWKILLLVGFMYVVAAFLNTIADVRVLSSTNFSLNKDLFLNNLKNNPIFGLVAEMGATIQTPMLIIEQIPFLNSYGFGKTFINSWVAILPNLGGIFQPLIDSVNYMLDINGIALGGSLVGELYYNFGMFGSLAAVAIGYLISKISDSMESAIEQKNYYKFAFYIPIFLKVLWWSRSNFASIIRLTAWNAILLILIKASFELLLDNKYVKVKKD